MLGALVGWLWPGLATNDWIKALGDGFIKLIKMVIAPIIFCTVVSGIAHIQDAKKVGRIGVKALVYFEVVSTFALVIGLVVGNVVKPGAGFGGAMANAQAVAGYAKQAEAQKSVDFFLHIIPDTVVGAFAQGEILQVLLFSILFGFALMGLGERGHTLRAFIDDAAHGVFGVIAIVMKAAPIGAFGAMAFTIGKFGTGAILNLMGLIATFYLTAALFVFVVLGMIARMVGFSIFKFLAYIKDELLIVLGTSSSESALPSLMEKLERLGCSKSVVGLVVPTGYSFNLDGTNIYMTLATLFIAQALGFDLTFGQQTHHPAGRDADLEGRVRHYRRGLHHAGGDAGRGRSAAGAGHGDRARHRQVHERMPRADQSVRQRRRLRGGVVVGRRTRSRQAARQSQQADRSVRRGDRAHDGVDDRRLPSVRQQKNRPVAPGGFSFSVRFAYSPPPKRRDHQPALRGAASLVEAGAGSAGAGSGAATGSGALWLTGGARLGLGAGHEADLLAHGRTPPRRGPSASCAVSSAVGAAGAVEADAVSSGSGWA